MNFMIRVQLYLPPELYKGIKLKAKQKKMTFAGYVRTYLESEVAIKDSEKTLEQRFPFLTMKFDWGPNAADNKKIDEALYGGSNGPL